jgi:cell filamentation protein
VYEVDDDTYCYPGTTVLRNLLDLRTQPELDAFETEITFQRSTELLPAGKLDDRHYRAIHRHLFQDVYEWAGELRSVRISKGGNPFCYPEYIERQLKQLFDTLSEENYFKGLDADAFAAKAAHFLAELNAIHPFREGDGRVQLSFLLLLAENAGHVLDLDRLDPESFMVAMIASFDGEEGPLANLIREFL